MHQLPLMECTFPPILFLHCRPFSCLKRTWWDGVKQDVWRGRIKGEPANPGLPGSWKIAIKPVCVVGMDGSETCVLSIAMTCCPTTPHRLNALM